jgi:paraquat-inducible protein A
MTEFDSVSAAARHLACCHSCGRVEPVEAGYCPRCHVSLQLRKPDSLQRTVALTIGALILYFPANLLPVLRVESTLNGTKQSTIISGVVQFWQDGDYPVAPSRSSTASQTTLGVGQWLMCSS